LRRIPPPKGMGFIVGAGESAYPIRAELSRARELARLAAICNARRAFVEPIEVWDEPPAA